MSSISSEKSSRRTYQANFYAALSLVSLVYLGATLFTPISPHSATYGLSEDVIRILQFCIAAPVIGIWYLALYGSLKFKLYARSIYQSTDGRALDKIASGLLILVFSLAINSCLQSFSQFMYEQGLSSMWTVLNNYVGMLGSLLAFGLIWLGSYQLIQMVNEPRTRTQRLRWLLLLVPAAICYLALLFNNPYRNSTPDPIKYQSYFLPDIWLVLTLFLPYLLIWGIGILAVVNLYYYYHHAAGVIYRRALSGLIYGLAAVISASVIIQLVVASAPSLVHLGLGQILIVLYLLIVVYAIGHIWIVSGARRLTRIEETT